ncbi:hypothetical protein HDU67_003683 [Dinochytrium kinnereticum]|nr:hypothetical protein HDU67_003683 [Dinochytrium kinnereticum]
MAPPLSYAQVHVKYTLPPIAALLFLSRPFLVATEVNKIALLAVIAVVYTTPWDNFIIARGAWTYPEDRVLGVIGYVPIEEYAFFVIQTVLTGLTTLLVQRWDLPILHLKTAGFASRWSPMLLFLIQFIFGCVMLSSESFKSLGWSRDECFYVGALLSWTAPVLALQWGVAGAYIWQRGVVTALAVWIPTIYLWCVDHWSLSQGVWEISRDRTLGIMVTRHLPLEEALFFFLVNCMIVFGLMAIDQTLAAIRLNQYADSSTSHVDWSRDPKAWKTVLTAVLNLGRVDSNLVEDAECSSKVLKAGSHTFHLASKLLPIPVSEDVQALYAFCRIADDLVDHTLTDLPVLPALKEFIDASYSPPSPTWLPRVNTASSSIASLSTKISSTPTPPSTIIGALQNFSRRIPRKVPRNVMDELVKAFEWDLRKQRDATAVTWFETEEELVEYCQLVAGSVGEACACIFSSWRLGGGGGTESVTTAARSMGVSLQLVNIARDLVEDAITLRRVYAPAVWVKDVSASAREILDDPLGQSKSLARLGKRLLELSGRFEKVARSDGVEVLGGGVKEPVRAALDMYVSIGRVLGMRCRTILGGGGVAYPRRVVIGTKRKVWILLKGMLLG